MRILYNIIAIQYEKLMYLQEKLWQKNQNFSIRYVMLLGQNIIAMLLKNLCRLDIAIYFVHDKQHPEKINE